MPSETDAGVEELEERGGIGCCGYHMGIFGRVSCEVMVDVLICDVDVGIYDGWMWFCCGCVQELLIS